MDSAIAVPGTNRSTQTDFNSLDDEVLTGETTCHHELSTVSA